MNRILVVSISWIAAVGLALGGGTFLRVYDQSHPPARESLISHVSREGRSVWCLFIDRDALDSTSRWNPLTKPLPLSREAATAIAEPEIAKITNNRTNILRLPPELRKIGMAKRIEEGDFYYYNFQFTSVGEPVDQRIEGTVGVLLDGSTIESRSMGCPAPRFGRGYGFLDDVNEGFVYLSAIVLLVLTTFVYAPVAVLLDRRVRARLLKAICVLAAIGAAMALVRARLGLDYPLINAPSGIEFGLLLGVLPAFFFVELLVRWLVSLDGARRSP